MKFLPSSHSLFNPDVLPARPRDRIPVRPLLALSVAVALVIGTALFFHQVSVKAHRPQLSTPLSVPAKKPEANEIRQDSPVVPPGLQMDAAQHAEAVKRLTNHALADLAAADAFLAKVRPYGNSDIDNASERVQWAQRDLAQARRHLEIVRALIAAK